MEPIPGPHRRISPVERAWYAYCPSPQHGEEAGPAGPAREARHALARSSRPSGPTPCSVGAELTRTEPSTDSASGPGPGPVKHEGARGSAHVGTGRLVRPAGGPAQARTGARPPATGLGRLRRLASGFLPTYDIVGQTYDVV